ncbi:MAG: biotin--[acetyl-CoA-carboxylase] ligase [Candidatus Sulfobium sp.]|jgi:BirA family biotin operon repressor/biotin-[acetyl-CoA-carboxylase] ligase
MMPHRVLRLLPEGEKFLSGEKISSGLGITRAAVWKKIAALRAEGFVIEATPSRGYRLIQSPDLSGKEIMARVGGALWKEVLCYKSLDSTNEAAVSLCLRNGPESGTVIVADTQEKGRGRLGRKWVSPPGLNIYMSIVLVPGVAPRDATLLTVLASVACAAALREKCGAAVSIKWPNDLMIKGKKAGGILTETRADPDRIAWAVTGIGVNVNMDPASFTGEIRRTATSIKAETGRYHARSGLIIAILEQFERSYGILLHEGRKPLIEQWRRLSCTLGRHVTVTARPRPISGFAENIDSEGMLLVRLPSGELKRIGAGDLTVTR